MRERTCFFLAPRSVPGNGGSVPGNGGTALFTLHSLLSSQSPLSSPSLRGQGRPWMLSRVKGEGLRVKGEGSMKGQGSRVKGQGSRVKGQAVTRRWILLY
eukprot:3817341-Rhodomonas_salina.5